MKLTIRNFRSIRDQQTEIAPMTVVYGQNGTGKSSLLYALLTLKNVFENPNRSVDDFFRYSFATLGRFASVVFDHQEKNRIYVGIETIYDNVPVEHGVEIGSDEGAFVLQAGLEGGYMNHRLSVQFPYLERKNVAEQIKWKGTALAFKWDGITATVLPYGGPESDKERARASDIAALLNAPASIIRKLVIVPLMRGFQSSEYIPIVVRSTPSTDHEVASLVAHDRPLVSKISTWVERIFDRALERDFQMDRNQHASVISLESSDKRTGITTTLVNDGFGVNQVVYLLAKCLHDDNGLVCIEEPEIHLHPTAVRKLARALAQMTREEHKTFLISTHSETFVMALLAMVAGGELAPSDLRCYWAQKDGKETKFELQEVNEKGQIEGGLASFMQGELEDLSALFKV